MPLSCSCEWEYEGEPGMWIYDYEESKYDFENLSASRGKRCCSCGKLIKVGDICIKYERRRYPWDDIESKIKCNCFLDDAFSDPPTIKIAPHYHCERCGEIWLNLTDIGYECLYPTENMEDSLKEYHQLTGFKVA